MSDTFLPIQFLLNHLEAEDGFAHYGYWKTQFTPLLDLGRAMYSGTLILQQMALGGGYWKCEITVRKLRVMASFTNKTQYHYPHRDDIVVVKNFGSWVDTKTGVKLTRVYRRERTTVEYVEKPLEIVQ